MRWTACIFAWIFFLMIGQEAVALTPLPSPIVKAELLLDAPAVKAGEAIRAGVRFTLPPGWHIYGENPGDAGFPTSLTWILPEGMTAGAIDWPTPKRFEVSGIVTYGYGGTVILPVPLTPARDGITGTVTVRADWVACADICIPESATLSAPLASNPEAGTALHATTAVSSFASIGIALGLAFLGGLLLNIMPCVLPILALKALAIAKKGQASRAAAAGQGLAYTAGVVASFLGIAALMLGLKATGAAVGWGFQLQNAWFVGVLAVVMLLVSANLLGLFSLPVLLGRQAHSVDDSTRLGTFLTGALAVLVATPCTAPFMATAIGATLSFPTVQALAVFASLGMGMAAPFLLISLWPAALRLLPKPGAWMVRFKQWLALPMLATAVWLLWVLVQLQTPIALPYAQHEHFSPARLAELRAQQKPVLVDVTAAWCITCKINERVALRPDSMQQFFREQSITVLVADWTQRDATITAYLAEFDRNGVPLYVYYPPQGEPRVLPQILTPAIIRDTIAASLSEP